MTDDEIEELLKDHKRYGFPDSIIERELMLGLVKSGDPLFLHKIPEPFLSSIVEFGLSLDGEWFHLSSNGMENYSKHAPKLKSLVQEFVNSAPLGKFIRWR
ncbi:hypothetical protein DU002_19245 [Corallincola holothuriorum]|uniref:Uncharacterized protein n=1 Tax=Corallincola holothuriorum TaxID=2282215 RepID=A0A368MXA6_9GAMM|nr:hypothetical protein [Corallincola holothuriorum]RCU42862.1 hypothetical protein DU002_19245 [Corallincola holothuriorum]